MDDWAGGNPRLVYDGTDQPDITSFTVGTATSLVISTGNSYRFMVRAINYCVASDANKACYSDFSDPSVFTARSPRAPLAPPMPYRSSKSNIGPDATTTGDGEITIRFAPPIDNGGAPITGYFINYAAAGQSYTEMSTYVAVGGNNDQLYEATIDGLTDGVVYRIYVVADNGVNGNGRSAASPILSTVCGMLPGILWDRSESYAGSSYEPQIEAIDSTSLTLSWQMPASDALGGTPITGYKVYMYPGVGLNTNANPTTVFNEEQVVTTSVDATVREEQQATVTGLGTNYFFISILGQEGPKKSHQGFCRYCY
jgi:hypothetical protein